MMENSDRPLMVQSDRTMLLDVHSPYFDQCRNDIINFSSLIKSPEHIHTYELTPLSIWNAISMGKDEDYIIKSLKKWSKYDIDERVLFFISDISSRYGLISLNEYDEEYYALNVKKKEVALLLKREELFSKFLHSSPNPNQFLIKKLD